MSSNAPNQRTPRSLDLQLLLFSETSNPKSYRISLSTIHRLGFFLGSMILICLILTATTLKQMMHHSIKTEPSNTSLELTREVESLQKKIAQLESERKETVPAATAPVGTPPSPILATAQPLAGLKDDFASLFQPSLRIGKTSVEALPIKIDGLRISSRGTNVRIRFALQYILQDKGNLEGRILIIAKGPGILLTYPTEALQLSQQPGLLVPQSGEFFSVSRYREVKADFGPTPKDSPIQSVAVFLFSSDDQLLFHEVHQIKQDRKLEPKRDHAPKGPSDEEEAAEPKSQTAPKEGEAGEVHHD